jgi:glyoxylase-like metal-dependent hydrolase (beta-lactamase superfamily II)
MFRKVTVGALLAILVASGAAAQDAKTVLANASQAIGGQNLTSLTYSGTASDVNFLQTRSINGPWPLRPISGYTRVIDLSQLVMRSTGQSNNPGPLGGPAVAGTYTQNIAANATTWAQQLDYWVTPWGFLKGATANNATVRAQRINGKNYSVVTWSPAGLKAPSGIAYTVNGYINDQNIVDRVETWVEHDLFGDMQVETLYSDYKDLGGLKVPTRIVQKRAGWPYFETSITAARSNPADLAQLLSAGGGGRGGGGGGGGGRGGGGGAAPAAGAPAPARGGQTPGAVPPVPTATGATAPAGGGRGGGGGGRGGGVAANTGPSSEKLADGVYKINGNYNALAVDFRDYVAVIEGAVNIARGEAILAEVKKVFPNKPIRYIINSHPHMDHAGGLAPFLADGAILVTHENNKKFFEDAFNAKRTLLNDSLAKSGKKPKIEAVAEKKVIRDENHSIELYHIIDKDPAKVHSDGIIVALLPKEKILFQADFSLPNPGTTVPYTTSLAEHVDRLKLDFTAYIPAHNSAMSQTKADLMRVIGK